MTVGRTYAPEWRDGLDPLIGRQVKRLTDSPAEDYHFYYYKPSITLDSRQVIFTSNRTGSSNI